MAECIFCKIARKEIKAEVVYEDEKALAFKDLAPQAPLHVLLIPKKHLASILDLAEEKELAGHLLGVVPHLARQLGVLPEGFRLVVNEGVFAGQAVAHVHFHLLGGRRFGWPPG